MKCKKQLKNYSAENEEKDLKMDCPILRENFEKNRDKCENGRLRLLVYN